MDYLSLANIDLGYVLVFLLFLADAFDQTQPKDETIVWVPNR